MNNVEEDGSGIPSVAKVISPAVAKLSPQSGTEMRDRFGLPDRYPTKFENQRGLLMPAESPTTRALQASGEAVMSINERVSSIYLAGIFSAITLSHVIRYAGYPRAGQLVIFLGFFFVSVYAKRMNTEAWIPQKLWIGICNFSIVIFGALGVAALGSLLNG